MPETSKTVDQAVRMMHQIRSTGAAPTAELARRLGLGRTVVARLVATLERHDLVRRTPQGIDLGYGLVGLADMVSPAVRSTARPHLQELADTFQETAVLAVVDGDDAVAVDQVVPDARVVRIHYRPGTRHSLAAAAHGRAMLAHADLATVGRLAAGRPGIEAELDRIRRRGYAVSHDELEDGVAGVAAAIVDRSGRPIASLGIVAPTPRLPSGAELAAAVVAAANQISGQLAGRTVPVS
ncbi:MAG: IclR family transcriptional regulator [Acidimicrobiia bacterium]